jgi:hypothetical protein
MASSCSKISDWGWTFQCSVRFRTFKDIRTGFDLHLTRVENPTGTPVSVLMQTWM